MWETSAAMRGHNDQIGVHFLGKAQDTVFLYRIVVNVQAVILQTKTVREILHAAFAVAGSSERRRGADVNQMHMRIEKILEELQHIYYVRAFFAEIRRENNIPYVEHAAGAFYR